jgi:lysophospholipase L1-like esterase
MARIQLSGNSIVIVFKDGKTHTGPSIKEGDSRAVIEGKINSAIMGAAGKFPDKAGELDTINASAAAATFARQLEAKGSKQEPARKEAPAPQRRAETAPKRAEPPARREAPKAAPREERKSEARRPSAPQPVRDQRWIDRQLGEMWKDDRKAQAAASALYSNRIYLERHLAVGVGPRFLRTDEQKAATVAVFNQLWQIPKFQMSLIAQTKAMPEFKKLYEYLRDPANKDGQMSVRDNREDILIAADMYIRYYLFAFIAHPEGGSTGFREEINQMKTAREKLVNIDGIRSYKPPAGTKEPTPAQRDQVMRLQLQGPMDPDTITAAALYMRRWNLEHPERGKAKTQEEISIWKAPAVITPPPEKEEPKAVVPPQPEVKPPTERKPAVPIPSGDPVMRQPRVGVIGDSISEDSIYSRNLQAILRETIPSAYVETYGVKSNTTGQMRSRFRQDILDKNRYNIVVIQGGVNDISGTNSVELIKANIGDMVAKARAKGMKVVLLTITPWKGWSSWSEENQKKTDEVNAWILSQGGPGVHVVDMSSMGVGNALRPEFDEDRNHLHPSSKGKAEMGRLIAEQAFGLRSRTAVVPQRAEATTGGAEKSPLEKHAEANWKDLKGNIYTYATSGNPAALVSLIKTPIPGQSTIEAALGQLKRDDIDRATDRLFNNYLKADPSYIEFCSARREYRKLITLTMDANTGPEFRRAIVRSMQDYLNAAGKRTDEAWYSKLGQDMSFLYNSVLGMRRDSLELSGVPDFRMLAAFGVFSWRKANQEARVGGFAANIPGVKLPEAKSETPGQEAPKRRTLKID